MSDFRRRLLFGWITLLLAMQAFGATNAPNILYIFTDDHTYRMVSCFPRSYEFADTPNIDRLAERGVRFDQAYMGAKCVPSRATMQTGRLQFAVESDYDGSDILGSIHWFPTIREKGYYTGMIGKWHYRQKGAEAYQHGTSWDWSVIWKHGDESLGDKYYWDQYVSIDGGALQELNGYSTDRYADFTEQFIEERAADTNSPPWFYWLCFGGVHGPYTPADRHIGTLDDEPEPPIPVDIYGPRPGKPSHFQDTKWKEGEDGKPYFSGQSLEFWVKQQMEAVLAIDEAVGRIVQKLEETGQIDNTIIVFTSDQGYVWGQHGLKGKIDPYETAIRSPFIVSNPARFPTNKVCKAPINGPDLIRTFHTWADAEPEQFMPGRDITPLIENPDSEPVLKEWSQVPTMMTYVRNRYEPTEIATRLQNEDWGGLEYESDTPYYFMILVENYKYTRYASPYRIEELYDLDSDPEELDNLALKVQFQAKLRQMRAACIQSIKDNGGVVFADLLPPPTTLNLWPDVYPSDNAHVLYGSGTAQDDSQVLKTKNGWGNSDSRMAYLRFDLSGVDEIAGYSADAMLSASLDLWMTQTEGDTENDLQVFALVDGAKDSSSSLSETDWTGDTGTNPLLDTNLPQGNTDPTNSPLTTAMLGSYTFAANGDNSELGLVQIPLSVSGLKALIQEDSNGEITLIVRSTSEGLSADFASVANTNSQHAVPMLTISVLPAAPTGLSANAGNGAVSLDWDDNAEPNLSGYNVYRSTHSGSYGSAIATNLTASSYFDNTVLNDTTYYYVVSAVDTDANASPQSTEVSAMPEEATLPTNAILFGSEFEGLAGFTQSTPATANESWSTETNSVRYRNQDGGTKNSSLLREFPLNRSSDSSYTIEGVVHLADGYADDNNRVGIYLFGDSAEVPNEDEAGAIGLIFNMDDGVTGGAPGDNSDDNIALRVGIDSTQLSGNSARNEEFVAFAQDLFGTEITFTVDIDFIDMGGTAMIHIIAKLRDAHGAVTEASTWVSAADYTGDWFGFVTRARARNYVEGGENTAANRSRPWVMDYKSFRVTDNSGPMLPTPASDFTYTTNSGAITITEYLGTNAVVNIPSMINGLPVSGMGKETFDGKWDLRYIRIPASLTSIDDTPITYCPLLTSIIVDPLNPAYCSVDGVLFNKEQTELILYPSGKSGASYVIPDSVERVDSLAFNWCFDLMNITLPEGLISLGESAFSYCISLENINVNLLNTIFSSEAGVLFNKDQTELILYPAGKPDASYVIADGVERVANSAFLGCSSLTEITFPSNITNIGESAFANCSGLTDITLQDGLTRIEDAAFMGCSSLTNISFQEGLTSIGVSAFYGCSSLVEINLPSSVSNLDRFAVAFCENLERISVNPQNTLFSSEDGVLFDYSKATLIQYPAGRTQADYEIPGSVAEIGFAAFLYSLNLEQVRLPESVTNIGIYAFYGCTNLTDITLPASVSKIDSWAFPYCTGLTGVYFQGDAPELGEGVFNESDNVTIYYLPGTTGWTNPWGGRPTVMQGETTAPSAPANLIAEAGNASVSLTWDNNTEEYLAGYSIYRSITSNNYSSAFVTNWSTNAYVDNAVSNNMTYYYVVTAVDTNGNESVKSAEVSAVPKALYDQWASENGVEGNGPDTDSDGDGVNNFYEYALGGNPTNRTHRGTLPRLSKSENRFLFVYPKRSDDKSITYRVETTTDLISGTWTNLGYVVTGTNVTGGTLDFVTNDVDTIRNKNFIRLIIEQ